MSKGQKHECQTKKVKRMRKRILYVGTFAELARFVELQVCDGYRVDDDDEEVDCLI